MDKLSKFVHYLRRCKKDEVQRRISVKPSSSYDDDNDHDVAKTPAKETSSRGVNSERDIEPSITIISVLESILLWDDTVTSVAVLIFFHIIFWSIVVLEVRGFAAASSAALVAVLGYSTLEAQIQRGGEPPDTTESKPKVGRLNCILHTIERVFDALMLLRRNQPGLFCATVCTFSLVFWILESTADNVLVTYTICMTVLIGPALILRVPGKIFSSKELGHDYAIEWDNEIEEFLPAATDDNLEVLQRAGESGEHCPFGGVMEYQIDPLNEDELVGLKMPSHEDGSTDGLDVSELELSTGDNDVDSIKIQSEHFEPGSSSDEEADLEPVSRKLPSHSDDESDSEFEIIDSQEIAHLDDV